MKIFFRFLFVDWLIDLIGGWIDWLMDCLLDWLIDWSIDWLIDRLIDWLFDWLTGSFDWSIDWLIFLFFLPCSFAGMDGVSQDPGAGLASAILQAFACGTFLFITFLEVLPHEMMKGSEGEPPGTTLLKILSMVLGFSVMAGLMFMDNAWTPPETMLALSVAIYHYSPKTIGDFYPLFCDSSHKLDESCSTKLCSVIFFFEFFFIKKIFLLIFKLFSSLLFLRLL